jgi:hypothetical protein
MIQMNNFISKINSNYIFEIYVNKTFQENFLNMIIINIQNINSVIHVVNKIIKLK